VRTTATEVNTVHNTCSHQHDPAPHGWIKGNRIECVLHGSCFDLDTGMP
jgi:nitrite reductase/ring-hydroxylating ferredoxin subunit